MTEPLDFSAQIDFDTAERIVVQRIDDGAERLRAVSREIHGNPETAFQERAAAALLAGELRAAGFDVEVAAGAREAVLAMATSGFDALVVDYSMPRSNGVELVRAMRAADIRVPIVMVSGVASDEEKRAAWDAGVDAYLDKFDLRQGVLTQTLRRLLGMNAADSA